MVQKFFGKNVIGFVVLSILSMSSVLLARSSPPKLEESQLLSKDLEIKHEKYQLPNGLTVILAPMEKSGGVTVNTWYNVGAVNEKTTKGKIQGRTGLAHLFEHLMFEKTLHLKEAGAHFKYLEKAGAWAINASTSFDRTNYYQSVPTNNLELALALESSRASFLQVDQSVLDEQRAVVRREREQRYETAPYGLASLKLWQDIFPKSHPYYGRVIGSHEHLEAATLEDVRNFYNKFYGPSNATLTLVGRFDTANAKSLIEKYYGTLPRKNKIEVPKVPKVHIEKQKIIRVEERLGKLTLVRMHYLTPSLFAKGDADLDMLAHILTGSENSRLSKALTRDEALANRVISYQQSLEQQSVFTIDVLLNPGVDESKAIESIDKVMASLETNPPSEIEIQRSRNSILTDMLFQMQKAEGYSGIAEILQTYHRFGKSKDYSIKDDLKRYFEASSESIRVVSKKYLAPNKRKILIAKPKMQSVARKGMN